MTAPAVTPELMTEADTAARLAMTRNALRQDRFEGRGLPFVRIGRRIRYRIADVDAYLAAHTVPARPKAPTPQLQ